MNIKKLSMITAATAAIVLTGAQLQAQDTTQAAPAQAPATGGGGPGGNGGGGRGGRGGFGGGGGAAFFQNMIKTQLKATDDEWAVIQPLLQKVQDAQTAARENSQRGGFGGMGGRRGQGGQGGGQGGANTPAAATPAPAPAAGGNPGGPGGGQPQGSAEEQALVAAIQSDATSNDDLKAKLQALRDARKKAQATLDAARADLQKVLTLRQEAILVNMGILE